MNRAKRMLLSTIACCLGSAALAPAFAQETYPSRPVTLVIPFPPGGATDVLGRVIGKKLGDVLGQSVVIDNRAGAGTVIGASYVAKAAPDGYTLLMSSGTTFTVNPAVRAKLPYDPVKSFEPIGITGRTGLILLAGKSVPANGVKQFVSLVKAAPDKYSYGSFGSGTTSQFAGEAFFHLAGLKIQHVPYKGSAPAMVDLMGGQIPFTVDTVSAAIPQLKEGKDQGHRRHFRQAFLAAAGRAHAGRERLRDRHGYLAGDGGSGRPAASRESPPGARAGPGDGRPRNAREAAGQRLRAVLWFVQGAGFAHREGTAPDARRGPARRHHRRLTT